MLKNRIELLEEAQEKLNEVINLLQVACKNDSNAEVYLIDQLKTHVDGNHGFLCRDLNIDILIDRYEEDCEMEDVSDDE